MTVIAWDGKQLAADRRTLSGGLIFEKTKIWRIGEALVGGSGEASSIAALVSWFRDGRDPAKWPACQSDKDQWSMLLAVWPNGELWKYEQTAHPIVYPPQKFAMGSGRDFALAAMYFGKTAREAVEFACHFDSGCGNGVDVLTHET